MRRPAVLLALSTAACAGLPERAAPLTAWDELTFVSDGVLLSSRSATACPPIAADAALTVNGVPARLEQRGGRRWGASQDGLTPAIVCDGPLFVAGSRPSGRVELRLTQGSTVWEVTFDEVNSPLSAPPATLPRAGGRVVVPTAPPGTTWTVPGHPRHNSALDLGPAVFDAATFRACAPMLGSPSWRPLAPDFGHVTAGPGQITLVLPPFPATCADAYELRWIGAAERPATRCPPGVTCTSWEEGRVTIPVLLR